MRYVCIAKCVFCGEVVRPGNEWDGEPSDLKPGDLDMLRGSFQESAPREKPAAAAKLPNGLTREQAAAKLGESGVPVPEGMGDGELAEYYGRVFGKRADGAKDEVSEPPAPRPTCCSAPPADPAERMPHKKKGA